MQTTALLLLGSIYLMAGAAHALTLHVAPGGKDTWSGQQPRQNEFGTDGPLATLAGARDAIRRFKQAGGLRTGGVTVELQGGTYEMAQSLALEAQDSGTADAPIVYRAAAGQEVRLTGARAITGFTPTTDAAVLKRLPPEAHGKVLQTDLKAQGITDYGKLTRRGFGNPVHEAHLELFFQDKPMTLARWPNGDGYARIAALPGGQEGQSFVYEGDRPARWVDEPEPWVFGYWYHDWADEYIPVEKIDPLGKTLTLKQPKPKYGFRNKQRFYALNLLSELDEPGEWYLDRATGILYFWPPAPLDQARVTVSILPSLLTLKDVSHVDLRGLILESTRGTAVTMTGGSANTIIGCTLRNIGNRGVVISDGIGHRVIGCDIYRTSDGGISLSGGDRATLTPAMHYAENNHIYDYSRWSRTYRPAIGVGGVGVRVAHNLLHHGQHNAIQLSGNDHVIEFNEIHSVAYETGDVGAFYMGRDWTARGTIIRHNYFHHIQGPGTYGAMGVYLDDQASGITISGNIFNKVTRAMFIGGGDDNLVENNIFIDCVPAVHIDARGIGWQKKATDDPNGELRRYLRAMPYQNELWSRRFPELVKVLDDDPGMPKRNTVVRNVAVGGKWTNIEAKGAAFQIVKDNLVDEDPQFMDRDKGDLRLKPTSPAFKLGFKPLPVEKMGLYQDERRASWPVVHQPRELPQEQVAEQPKPRSGPAPVFKVARLNSELTVDGTIEAGEWNGANVTHAIPIEQSLEGGKAGPPSHAWIYADDTGLRIAIDNAVDPNATLKKGNTWGDDDAVEVALRGGDKNAPILVFRGFPSGHWLVSPESGAAPAAVQRATHGTEYAARAVDQGRWTAEWRIPWTALGITPAAGMKLAFNLTVRKSAEPVWLMWQSTGGNSFLVDRAGVLELVGG